MGKHYKNFNKNYNGHNAHKKNRAHNKKFNKKNVVQPDNKITKPKVEPINYNVKAPLFDKSRLLSSWKINRKMGPGLVNGANTCFLNSVLECLTYTPPLAQQLLKSNHFETCKLKKEGFCALCAMQRHAHRSLVEPKSYQPNAAILPRYFTSNLRALSKTLRLGRQEDAHEFYMSMLGAMQKACTFGLGKLPPKVEETSFIHQVFGGKIRSQLKCHNCGATSNNYEACLDLSIDINSVVLEKNLNNFTKVDLIGSDDPDNRYKCDACKQKVQASKQMTMDELPMMLSIHLKRFAFDIYLGRIRKITSRIAFPPVLNMAPYVSEEKKIKEANYGLYGVLVHQGMSCDSGHYYAYVKAPNGQWYLADDETVSPVPETEVLAEHAYMLFYQQQQVIVEPTDSPAASSPERSPSPPAVVKNESTEIGRPALVDLSNKKGAKTKKSVTFASVVHSDDPSAWTVRALSKPLRSLRGNLSPPTFAAHVQDENSWIVRSVHEYKDMVKGQKRKSRVKLLARKSPWTVAPY